MDTVNGAVQRLAATALEVQKSTCYVHLYNDRQEEVYKEIMAKRLSQLSQDKALKVKLDRAICGWPGSKFTNSVGTLPQYLDTLRRELGLDDDLLALVKGHSPSFAQHPHILVSCVSHPVLVRKRTNRETTKLEVKLVLKSQETPIMKAESYRSILHKFFYEDLAKDVLEVHVYRANTKLGTAQVPLHEICGAGVTSWFIDNNEQRRLGTIDLAIEFQHKDCLMAKDIIINQLTKCLLSLTPRYFDLEQDQPAESAKLSEQLDRQAEYYLLVNLTTKDTSKQLEAYLALNGTNRSGIVSGSCRLHYTSLTEDRISIGVTKAKPVNTVRKILDFDKETEPDVAGGKERKKSTSSLTENVYAAVASVASLNLSPDNKPLQPKRMQQRSKAEQQNQRSVFEHSLDVHSIPWTLGQKVEYDHGNFEWHISIRCDIGIEDYLENILLLVYHQELKYTPWLQHWDGQVGHNSNIILTILRPYCDTDTWEIARAQSLLQMHAIHSSLNNQLMLECVNVLVKNKVNLENKDYISSYKSQCVKNIGFFDVRSLINSGSGHLDESIWQVKFVLRSLQMLFQDQDYDLHQDLSYCMESCARKAFDLPTCNSVTERLDNIQGKIQDYCLLTLQTIVKRFDNFGVAIWCPLLADACLTVLLPLIDASLQSPDSDPNPFHESSFKLYIQTKALADYTLNSAHHKELYKIFDKCLESWATCAASKAAQQVSRVLEMERDKHEGHVVAFKKPSVKKKRWIKRRFGTSKKSEQHAKVSRTWSIEDSEYSEWIEAANNVHGIFHSCNITWQQLGWPDHTRSIQFGSDMFRQLHQVFKGYVQGMKDIVLQDDEFDHHELVLSLNSLFQSKQYLDTFLELLSSQMHKIADQDSHLYEVIDFETKDDTEDAIYEDVQEPKEDSSLEVVKNNVFDLLSVANQDVYDEADEIISAFCECQKKHFKRLIKQHKFGLTSLEEEEIYEPVGEPFDDDDQTSLLGYLDSLLAFFNAYLDTGQETKKYKELIKEKLFEIHEEEILKYVDNNPNSKQQALYANLYNVVDETIRFRRTVSLKDSQGLASIKSRLRCKGSRSVDLVSKFLAIMEQEFANPPDDKCSTGEGHLRFAVGHDVQTRCVQVVLKSIKGLIPREGKTTCNFSLNLSLQPFTNMPEYRVKKSTRMYEGTKELLFDLFDEDDDANNYTFELNLPQFGGQHYDARAPFLALDLFDHSVTKTNKIFRGRILMSLQDIAKTDDDEIKEDTFQLLPSTEEGQEIIKELKERHDGVAKSFIKDIHRYTKQVRIPDTGKIGHSTPVPIYKSLDKLQMLPRLEHFH